MTENEFYQKLLEKRPERSHVQVVEHTGNIGYNDKLKFRCTKHNKVFEKIVGNLIHGAGSIGCPDCKKEDKIADNKRKGEEWLAKLHAKLGHDNYEMLGEWVRSTVPIRMRCKKHGQEFDYHPVGADRGTETCTECFKEKNGYYRRSDFHKFIEQANFKFGHGKFTYDESSFTNFKVKMKIHCPLHKKTFEQKPSKHLSSKHGCPFCAEDAANRAKSLTLDECQKRIDDIHGKARYAVLGVNKKNGVRNFRIWCEIHKTESQKSIGQVFKNDHLCDVCISEAISNRNKGDVSELLEKAILTHGDKFDYSMVEYAGSHNKVEIRCKKHDHKFYQVLGDHVRQIHSCPKCSNTGQSRAEKEVVTFIQQHYDGTVIENTRSIGDERVELDIYLPDINFGVEYNGSYYHSDKMKPITYHRDKLRYFNSHGVDVLFVWDFDWENPRTRKVIEQMVLNKLGKAHGKKYHARKLNVTKVGIHDVRGLYDDHHIQGSPNGSTMNYALVDSSDGVVAAMSFTKNPEGFELTRFATSGLVRGGFSKLLNSFKKDVGQGVKCISFCDLQHFNGSTYEKLGFRKVGTSRPDYKVFHPKTGALHKFNWRRVRIPLRLKELGKTEQVGFNPDKSIDPRSERDIQDEVNALRVFDCGKVKYELIT